MDCDGVVPLYKISKFDQTESYLQILSWTRAFHAYDRIWYDGYSERHANTKLSDPNSNFCKAGREIAQDISNAMQIPVYYTLYRYGKKFSDNCPICKQYWVNTRENDFDFRCDECKLVGEVL